MTYLFISIFIFIAILLVSLVLIVYDKCKIEAELSRAEIENCKAETAKITSITKYDEKEIIAHLDYIVSECIDEYMLYNVSGKDIYYINSKDEEEMLNVVKKNVTDRISPTLIDQLSFIYNADFLGSYIANYVYIKVSTSVAEFNATNEYSK